MTKLGLLCVVLAACSGDGGGGIEGRFSFSWELTTSGATVDCATAGVETVRIVTNDGVATQEDFLCTDGEATTGPRAPGVNTVRVSGLASDEGVIATSQDQGTIIAGEIVELGVFPLETAEVCDASTCPLGCCFEGGCIEPQTDIACGRAGVECVSCTAAGQTCNTTEGMCID